MANIIATQLRAGMIINYEGELCRVVSVEHQTPGNLPARVVTKMKRLKDGINRENRFGSSDKIERASLEQHMLEFLYEDGDNLVLMNGETYEQMEVNKELVGDDLVFLQPNMQVEVEFNDGTPLSVTLPDSVVLEIIETEPVIKNANATGSYKPAKLENGVTVGIPPYIESGERIRIKLPERTYIERAK
jgi:elongation factor P